MHNWYTTTTDIANIWKSTRLGRYLYGRMPKKRTLAIWAQICKPFKEPRNRFLAARYDNPIWRIGPPGYIGWQIDSLESIPALLKRLQIRALNSQWISFWSQPEDSKLLRKKGVSLHASFVYRPTVLLPHWTPALQKETCLKSSLSSF